MHQFRTMGIRAEKIKNTITHTLNELITCVNLRPWMARAGLVSETIAAIVGLSYIYERPMLISRLNLKLVQIGRKAPLLFSAFW